MTLNPLLVAALVALLLAGWAVDRTTGENRRLTDRIGDFEQDAGRDAQLIAAQAAALKDRRAMTEALGRVSAATSRLAGQLDQQADALAAGLEELKRNDTEARDYLRGLVPAAVGVRHARPETTDVAAYRAAASGMPRADAVPSAGPPRIADQ